MFTFTLVISVEKTARTCSKRMATSRPRFSPASVTTEKWGERTSIHCGPSAPATVPRQKTPASRKRCNLNHKGRAFINTATYGCNEGQILPLLRATRRLPFDQAKQFPFLL